MQLRGERAAFQGVGHQPGVLLMETDSEGKSAVSQELGKVGRGRWQKAEPDFTFVPKGRKNFPAPVPNLPPAPPPPLLGYPS